jgi:hypothetical protein
MNREYLQTPVCAVKFYTSNPASGNGGRRYHRPGVDALARNVAREATDDHHA